MLINAGLIFLFLFLLTTLYVAWVVRKAVSDTEQVRTGVAMLEHAIEISAELVGTDRRCKITSIDFPKAYGEKLGVGTPSGFEEKPMTLEDAAEPDDPQSVESIRRLNEQNIFWRGSVPLLPNKPVTIHIPIEKRVPGHARVGFWYEGRIGFSIKDSHFHVDVSIEFRLVKELSAPGKKHKVSILQKENGHYFLVCASLDEFDGVKTWEDSTSGLQLFDDMAAAENAAKELLRNASGEEID